MRQNQKRPTRRETSLFIPDIAKARMIDGVNDGDARGRLRYGTSLFSDNERDVLQDLSEEMVDAWQYLTQARAEHDQIVRAIAALAVGIHRLPLSREGAQRVWKKFEQDIPVALHRAVIQEICGNEEPVATVGPAVEVTPDDLGSAQAAE